MTPTYRANIISNGILRVISIGYSSDSGTSVTKRLAAPEASNLQGTAYIEYIYVYTLYTCISYSTVDELVLSYIHKECNS